MQRSDYGNLDSLVKSGISRRTMLKALAGGLASMATVAAMDRLSVPQAGAQEAPGMEPSLAKVGDTTLAYIEAGRGDPVVLVHGTLNDFRSWGMQLEPLASG